MVRWFSGTPLEPEYPVWCFPDPVADKVLVAIAMVLVTEHYTAGG